MVNNKSLYPDIPGMTLIPGGWFLMGSTEDERQTDEADSNEDYLRSSRPQHSVYLPSYYIGSYPVTNLEYKTFIDDTDYDIPSWPLGLAHPSIKGTRYDWDTDTRKCASGLENCPVVLVSWYDALAYCNWSGKRLPTEAEWEKAARGGDNRPYPWGWDNDLQKHANINPSFLGKTISSSKQIDIEPVDAHPSGCSIYGCNDMLGNCEEWCADWFDEKYYLTTPSHSPKGPTLPGRERYRVVRGCGRYWQDLHVALRSEHQPWLKDCDTSFRCVLDVRTAKLGLFRSL